MSLTRDEIKIAAMQLNPTEREALAEELLLSIDNQQREAIDAAWLTEAARRDANFRASKTSAKPFDQIIDRLSSGNQR